MDELYRNKEEIVSDQNNIIDAGSLWEKKDDLMILVDDDQFETIDYDETLFEKDS